MDAVMRFGSFVAESSSIRRKQPCHFFPLGLTHPLWYEIPICSSISVWRKQVAVSILPAIRHCRLHSLPALAAQMGSLLPILQECFDLAGPASARAIAHTT